MILWTLTNEAEKAAQRYNVLTGAWRALFHEAMNMPDFAAGARTTRVIQQAYDVAQVFLDEERQAIARIFMEIALEAHQTTLAEIKSDDASKLTELALEHLRVTEQYLIDELIAQVHRDVALLRSKLQQVVLEVSLSSRSRGISTRTALIEYRIGNQSDLEFMFLDRAARKWSSQRFVRTVWRHTLLAVYNEIVLMTLADHGLTTAMVIHENADAQSHNMRIALSSNNELPTYSEIRDTVFHPNANAILAMDTTNV